MIKNIIKVIVFISIFCIIWHLVFSVLWVDKNSTTYFFEEPKNSFDIVYVGSSNVLTHFNSVLAFDLYGYATGMLTTASQPFSAVEYLIKESRKYQNPNLYVIDISKAADDFDIFPKEDIRRCTDSMKFSKNRIEAINELLSYTDMSDDNYLDYYFSFFMYHNRWKNLTESNFADDKTLYKGYLLTDYNIEVVKEKTDIWNDTKLDLPEENEKTLTSLMNYINENNLNVLFVIPSREFEPKHKGRLNTITTILQENNFKVINFNKLDDFKINYETDLYQQNHLNVYGATKYTLYFAKYLHENYELKNHKGDENYSTWQSEYERFKIDFNKLTKKDFNDYLY